MFVLSISYNKPLEEAKSFMKEHIEYRDKYYNQNKFICSGKKITENGGIILCNAKRIEIDNIINEDPLYRNGIINYELIEFNITKCLDDFKCFISK